MLSVNLAPSFESVWCRPEFAANTSPLAIALDITLPLYACFPRL